MPIASIKRYLGAAGSEETLRQVISLLVDKLGESAVDAEPDESSDFRMDIRAIREALTLDLPQENLLILVQSATQALETYNGRITRRIANQTANYQTIIKLLQNTLVKTAGENAETVQNLARIGEDLERGNGFKDLQSLKLELSKCLSSLRDEVERARAGRQSVIEKLQIEIESYRELDESLPQRKLDAATGLARQSACIEAIQEAIDIGTRHYAVVMVVNRVQPVNARFGREAGDRMLSRFKEYVETQLRASDQLFRWTGPAVVAILERPETFDHVCATVRHMLDSSIDANYEVNGRSVLIPVSAAWSVIMLTATPEAIARQIQTFIASSGCPIERS